MTPDDVDSIDSTMCPTASTIPMLGLGTWQASNDDCTAAVQTALECGYRHIDTAQGYDNEDAVGEGIAASDVDRDDIFLATKVSSSNLAHEDILETARESVDRLGVESVDLLYVHWPSRAYDPEGTLSAFDQLYDEGLIENVGISNFEPEQIEQAVALCDAPILANQVECHPLLPQEHIRDACANYDIEVVAYSPLARGSIVDQPEIQEIAAKHNVTETQVSLAWLHEKGVTAIPKSVTPEHIRDNWRSLTLDLEQDDINRIDAIDETSREVDPSFAPWN
ncbi:aldo/keto reductase [Natronolimnobius sp. AArcel1]|uniref:aldo/keto reductase n=1 Tax=Natronolimnobius sp. AArcel1 TaxID=1679093 RepID=UPI0013ED5AA6|nr:aldo/keto reductase [Natronolimnobius sp. AArcel1]NGM69379.1 aldo/keto reductase [Natronolimnobius sp. AArcel1]